MLASCFTSHQVVFQSALEAMRPGGWIEMQDLAYPLRCVDDSMAGTAFERWLHALDKGLQVLGRDLSRGPRYKRYLADAGFVDIVEKQLAWPIGAWPRDEKMKQLGVWFKQDLLEGLQAWSMSPLTRGLGMTTTEVELLLMEVRNDINSRRLHVYMTM
jgi:hypothetical protein